MIESKSGIGGKDVEKESGLAPDYINAWMMILGVIKDYNSELTDEDRQSFLDVGLSLLKKPVQKYGEYFLTKNYPNSQQVLEESDKNKVEAVDKLVADFNADRERILREKDIKTLIDFAKKINLIVRGSENF